MIENFDMDWAAAALPKRRRVAPPAPEGRRPRPARRPDDFPDDVVSDASLVDDLAAVMELPSEHSSAVGDPSSSSDSGDSADSSTSSRPPPAPPPAYPPPPAPDREAVVHVPRLPRERGAPWYKRPVYTMLGEHVGYLVYDKEGDKFDAHCNVARHYPSPNLKCHIHKQICKKPLGYLIAWLFCGGDCATRGPHMDKRFRRRDGQELSLENRVWARVIGGDQPELAMFFEIEGDLKPEEEPPEVL